MAGPGGTITLTDGDDTLPVECSMPEIEGGCDKIITLIGSLISINELGNRPG